MNEDTNAPAMSEESEREPKTSARCGIRMRFFFFLRATFEKIAIQTEKEHKLRASKLKRHW
jgi:hypothetical protein